MTLNPPLSKRAARLAAKPRCGMLWASLEGLESPWHECKKFLGHAGRQHECACGATKARKVPRAKAGGER